MLVLFDASQSLVPLLGHDYREWATVLPLFPVAMTRPVHVKLFSHWSLFTPSVFFTLTFSKVNVKIKDCLRRRIFDEFVL